MTKFQISIVSDNVCPWCYVGKKKLDRGITLYKAAHPDSKDTFSTTWYPFYLNPGAPKIGIDKRQYYLSKFGEQRTATIFEYLSAVGKDCGINFRYGGKTGNTRDSHRLVQLGKRKGTKVQDKVIQALFASYFENEEDITSHEVLKRAGVKAGLDESEVNEWLKSDKGGKEVDAEVRQAQMKDIRGVPYFTLQGRYEIREVQDPQAFVQIFETVKAMKAS